VTRARTATPPASTTRPWATSTRATERRGRRSPRRPSGIRHRSPTASTRCTFWSPTTPAM